MVESIEEFSPEYKVNTLFNWKYFSGCNVPVIESRAVKDSIARIPKVVRRRCHKARRIEENQPIGSKVLIPDLVSPVTKAVRAHDPECERREVWRRWGNWISPLKGGNKIRAPVAEYCIQDGVHVA